MKKILAAAILGIALLSSTGTAFAATHVSQLAVTEGGRTVAACAQSMDKGVSSCINMTTCNVQ